MNTTLVVVRAFAAHAKGDVIADTAQVAAILASEQRHNVVRVLTNSSPPKPATPGTPGTPPAAVAAPAPTATTSGS